MKKSRSSSTPSIVITFPFLNIFVQEFKRLFDYQGFHNATFVLALNKFDVFISRLQVLPLQNYFPEYSGNCTHCWIVPLLLSLLLLTPPPPPYSSFLLLLSILYFFPIHILLSVYFLSCLFEKISSGSLSSSGFHRWPLQEIHFVPRKSMLPRFHQFSHCWVLNLLSSTLFNSLPSPFSLFPCFASTNGLLFYSAFIPPPTSHSTPLLLLFIVCLAVILSNLSRDINDHNGLKKFDTYLADLCLKKD